MRLRARAPATCASRRSACDVELRRGRGDPHRDQREVHARARRRGLRRRRPRARRLAHRPAGALRAVARRAGVDSRTRPDATPPTPSESGVLDRRGTHNAVMENVLADRAPQRLRRSARLLRLASDERLVALVRDGDEGAFEALYDRHHRAILGFCRHMLGTREEAEDAVQHTFLAAFRELAGSTKRDRPAPWLFTIARNRCLSLLRARRSHVAIELRRAGDRRPGCDGRAARGSARAARRPRLPAGGPARGAAARGAGRARPRGDRRSARLPAREGQGARVPGAHVARRQPRRRARPRASRSAWNSRRRAAARCDAARCAGICAPATAAARSRPRSPPSAGCWRSRCRSCRALH